MDTKDRVEAEWDLSRKWLKRGWSFLIGGMTLTLFAYVFRPVAIAAGVCLMGVLVSFAVYAWHLQRSADIRRKSGIKRHTTGLLRFMSDHPLVVGCGVAGAWMAVGIIVVALAQRS